MTTEERHEIRSLLFEAPVSYTIPASQRIRSAWVDYYAITPKGARGRFNRVFALSNLRGAQSETAIYFFLKERHPGCEIKIFRLQFR